MYAMLDVQMIKASRADRTQDILLAGYRRELRQLRRSTPAHGSRLKRLAAATAALVMLGGDGDALPATNVRFDSSSHTSA